MGGGPGETQDEKGERAPSPLLSKRASTFSCPRLPCGGPGLEPNYSSQTADRGLLRLPDPSRFFIRRDVCAVLFLWRTWRTQEPTGTEPFVQGHTGATRPARATSHSHWPLHLRPDPAVRLEGSQEAWPPQVRVYTVSCSLFQQELTMGIYQAALRLASDVLV